MRLTDNNDSNFDIFFLKNQKFFWFFFSFLNYMRGLKKKNAYSMKKKSKIFYAFIISIILLIPIKDY